MRNLNKSIAIITMVLSLISASFNFAIAQVMSSTNYKIFVDTVNGGGGLGTSANYKLTDTMGEVGTTENVTSTNYIVKAGFEAINKDQILTVNLSTSEIKLGILAPSQVNTSDETITVTTNGNGYSTTIADDGNLRATDGADINNVIDGAVTAGSEEFGIGTSGSDGLYNSADTSISTVPKTIAQRSSSVNGSVVTVTFKASVVSTTAYDDYSNVVTFSTTGNF